MCVFLLLIISKFILYSSSTSRWETRNKLRDNFDSYIFCDKLSLQSFGSFIKSLANVLTKNPIKGGSYQEWLIFCATKIDLLYFGLHTEKSILVKSSAVGIYPSNVFILLFNGNLNMQRTFSTCFTHVR